MALENLLLPGETVKYRSPGKVRLGDQKYHLITTEKRLILYRRLGAFFKTEEFRADGIPEVLAISYKEILFRMIGFCDGERNSVVNFEVIKFASPFRKHIKGKTIKAVFYGSSSRDIVSTGA